MPRTTRASPSRKTMSPWRSTSRPHRCQRAISGLDGSGGRLPGRPGAGRGRAPIIARPGGRFHPVGCFRRTLFVRRQRDHPAEDIEHGESPGASWGVWAKGSGTVPRPLIVLGKPPCTEMALSWVTVRTSSRSETHRRLGAKSQELAHDRWIVSEHSAEDRMVVCVGSVTPQSRPRLLITHGACSGVADGILAMRLLPHKSFCMSFYHKTYSFTTGLSEVLPVVSCQHPSNRASYSSSACRASSRPCT